jgi:hypothetical protein
MTIFKACLAKEYIPKAWRQVKVTFIPKHRNANYTEAKAYHPNRLHAENNTKICGKANQGGDLGAMSPTSIPICLETKEVHRTHTATCDQTYGESSGKQGS